MWVETIFFWNASDSKCSWGTLNYLVADYTLKMLYKHSKIKDNSLANYPKCS
jgi:hypothetical protein